MSNTISAREYEQGFRPFERGCVIEAAHRVAVPALDLARGDRLLDLGCGAGALIRLVADAGVSAVGTDYSERALAAARAALPGGRFVRGNAAALPFPDACFDRIAALGVLGYVSQRDLARVLAECARVLRPGGMLLICTGRPLNRLAGLSMRLRHRRLPRAGPVGRSHIHPPRLYRRELHRLGFRVHSWVTGAAAPNVPWFARRAFAPRWFRAERR